MNRSAVQEFMDKTKLCNMGESGKDLGVPRPGFELNPEGAFDVIALPAPEPSLYPCVDVTEAIESRMSARDYSPVPMKLSDLSLLLWCTQGIKRVIPGIVALRNVPSAGARNALETYLLINHVEGLVSGLYKYVALSHQLLKLCESESLKNEFSLACDDQDQVRTSNVTFIWTAVPDRMTWSYAERGYRYLLIDVGHVCQNLYLTAEKLNLGVCAIGHFDDDRLNSLLGIDGDRQFSVYLATVGVKS